MRLGQEEFASTASTEPAAGAVFSTPAEHMSESDSIQTSTPKPSAGEKTLPAPSPATESRIVQKASWLPADLCDVIATSVIHAPKTLRPSRPPAPTSSTSEAPQAELARNRIPKPVRAIVSPPSPPREQSVQGQPDPSDTLRSGVAENRELLTKGEPRLSANLRPSSSVYQQRLMSARTEGAPLSEITKSGAPPREVVLQPMRSGRLSREKTFEDGDQVPSQSRRLRTEPDRRSADVPSSAPKAMPVPQIVSVAPSVPSGFRVKQSRIRIGRIEVQVNNLPPPATVAQPRRSAVAVHSDFLEVRYLNRFSMKL